MSETNVMLSYNCIILMCLKCISLPVLSSPTFDKAHANGTHPGELVDGLKALVD